MRFSTILWHSIQEVFMNIQLELNLDNKSSQDLAFEEMRRQLAEMNESMGKVRRKLFAELGEVKKQYIEIKNENESLKSTLHLLKNQKTEWLYHTNDSLFEVSDKHLSA